MRAVCWEGKEKIHVETVPDPVILNPRNANVKVTTTATCGSDLQHLRRGHPDDADGPHCTPTPALGESDQLLEACGIKTTLPSVETDIGVLAASEAASVIDDFVADRDAPTLRQENRPASRVRG